MNLFVLHAGEPDIAPLLERLAVPSGTRVPDPERWDVLFRWGVHAAEPAGLRANVLNPLRSVLRSYPFRASSATLALHGIRSADPFGNAGETFSHVFVVPVFHLQPLALCGERRLGPLLLSGRGNEADRGATPLRELPLPWASHHERRAVRQAVRATYALGLDFASVRIGVTSGGRTLVTGIDPVPPLDERLAELLAGAISAYVQEQALERRRRKPATLGADPEFVLRGPDGRLVPASRFLAPDGRAGSDSVHIRGGTPVRPLAELRPAPSADPRALVRHLREAMLEAERLIGRTDLSWLAGGQPASGLPLGGHIHFGGIRPSSLLLRVLDNYMALPFSLLESAASARRRPRYGFLGDFRSKPHGGFEYRTLPSWLGSPERALGVLALARLVADHHRELRQTPLDRQEVLSAFYAGDKARLRPIVEALWTDLEGTWSYEAYRAPLDRLKTDCLTLTAWNEADDFRPNWRLPPSDGKLSQNEKGAPAGGILL